MPRVTLKVPGTLPSRSRSRGSRKSTSTTSSRPASFTASAASISSISRLAASTIDLTLFVIFCGTSSLHCSECRGSSPKLLRQTPCGRHVLMAKGRENLVARVPMLARLAIPAVFLALTACAAAVPGYSPPPFKEQSKFAKPLESGDVGDEGRYEMSAAEKAMDCKRLTGSMQIVMARLKDAYVRMEPSAVCGGRTENGCPHEGRLGPGCRPAGVYARERAKLDAYNAELAAKNCKTLDIEASLPRPIRRARDTKRDGRLRHFQRVGQGLHRSWTP